MYRGMKFFRNQFSPYQIWLEHLNSVLSSFPTVNVFDWLIDRDGYIDLLLLNLKGSNFVMLCIFYICTRNTGLPIFNSFFIGYGNWCYWLVACNESWQWRCYGMNSSTRSRLHISPLQLRNGDCSYLCLIV